jgi:hypothetical protein
MLEVFCDVILGQVPSYPCHSQPRFMASPRNEWIEYSINTMDEL